LEREREREREKDSKDQNFLESRLVVNKQHAVRYIDRMRILLFLSIVLTLTKGVESSVFSEYRKARKESSERVKKPLVGRKLSQKKEDVEFRQNRIQDSMDRLDALLAEGKSHESRNSSTNLNKKVNLTAIINEHRRLQDDNDGRVSFLETGSKTKIAPGVLGAAANLMFSRTTMCVMCSYILEMVDRQVKASPRWANGGGGFFPGQVDFSPGENQGFFRTYPGGYLEISESSPIGSGVPEPPRNSVAHKVAKTLQKQQKITTQRRDSKPSEMRLVEQRAKAQPAYSAAKSTFGAGTSNGMDQKSPLSGRKVRIGRFTPRDYDRVDSQSEKSMEYQQMFKDLMDALDEVCFKDLPEEYAQYCSLPFNNGEALVEFYLHDYEDWEICTKIYSCLEGFYDDT